MADMTKTLGGDRLGSGKKIKVHLHNYERSTHDLGYIFRSTMSAGTLVPFLVELALPGDTFDIDLNCDIKTHPTIGPLFGSYKVQLDIFQAPIRLYHSALHNNMLGIGMSMSQVKLPIISASATKVPNTVTDVTNSQINPSCILAYLGIRGFGIVPTSAADERLRSFNAIPLLAYWEIYKNYYANKQEEIGAVIHSTLTGLNNTVTSIVVWDDQGSFWPIDGTALQVLNAGMTWDITYAGAQPNTNDIIIILNDREYTLYELQATTDLDLSTPNHIKVGFNPDFSGIFAINWRYRQATDPVEVAPSVLTFPLENIDTMRINILKEPPLNTFAINTGALIPYVLPISYNSERNIRYAMFSQEGLGIKTYQSDLFNNWLQTEWIDGVGGISDITSIDTTGGSFTIDTLILARKVYNMLNRVMVSGGTYDDWLDAVYAHDRYKRAETPMYMGGLMKELVFQEVVSNSGTEDEPLGTLAGKGVMAKKHKGGYVHINVDEPSYIIGIVSLTPRIDYSQGNRWDVHLSTMDDLHKPELSQIGFQELITEQMAWWDTTYDTATTSWITKSAGKQPAWINYMTNYNRTYGNFAIEKNEMFMTLNRRYEPVALADDVYTIDDLTTYIDPSKYNFIFAQTALDAQNFWAQIAVDMTVRRKMSAKVMPNL